MSKKIEQLKKELKEAYREELSDNTVCVRLTLNGYGFFTQIEEETPEGLKASGKSMRNIKGQWV